MRSFPLILLCLLLERALSQPIQLDNEHDHSVYKDVPIVASATTPKVPLTFEELLEAQNIDPIVQASLIKVDTPEEAAELAFAIEQAGQAV